MKALVLKEYLKFAYEEVPLTVSRLRDGGDAVGRKTILPVPRLAIVLFEVVGRIQSKRMRQQEQTKQPDANAPNKRPVSACFQAICGVPRSGCDGGRDGQQAGSQRSVVGIIDFKCRTKTTHFLRF